MKLVSWNINGIRAVINKKLFHPMMEALQPDVLCLQETKAQQGQAEIDLPEYEEYWNSAVKKGYSGTAIFTKHKPLSVRLGFPERLVKHYKLADDSYGDPDKEGRVMAIELHDCFVVNVYTPNSKPDLSRLELRHRQWDPAFLEYCVELEKEKPVLFCGDLNVAHTEHDLKYPKANEGEHGFTREERAGIDLVIKHGFVDTFRAFHPDVRDAYTWWSHFGNARANNSGWRIDYWFASKKLMKHIKKAEIHPQILGSDHCPVSVELDFR